MTDERHDDAPPRITGETVSALVASLLLTGEAHAEILPDGSVFVPDMGGSAAYWAATAPASLTGPGTLPAVAQGHKGYRNVTDTADLLRRVAQTAEARALHGNPAPPYKADEAALLVSIYENCGIEPGRVMVRELLNALSNGGRMPFKRACYVLGKFIGWGFYEYGVSLDLGWLTPEGKAQAAAFLAAWEAAGSGEGAEHGSEIKP